MFRCTLKHCFLLLHLRNSSDYPYICSQHIMSRHSASTHILDRSDYSKHLLVSFGNDELAPLAPSSFRFRSRILGLTTNNLTYARLGMYMGWYDIYPLPPTTPAPYNSEVYGRIAGWGYAEITESTVPEISPGQTIYGYLPISTGIETVRIAFAEHEGKKMKRQIIVLDEHRQHLWKIYNRYHVCASLEELEKTKGLDSLGWNSILTGLFGTSYNLNRYGFAWNDVNRIHPSGKGEWTRQDADLHNATVIILNASGKTGMSFAYNLRYNRPKEYQPKTIVGVGSEASVSMIKQSGFCDKVVLNSDPPKIKESVETSDTQRVVLFDFGARSGAAETWHSTLSSCSKPYTRIVIGGEVKIQDPEATKKRFTSAGSLTLVNASLLSEKGIESGGEEYFDEVGLSLDAFKTKIAGMRLQWGEGLEGWKKGWELLCKDEVRADTGLVYRV
jgi:hypothetical protein